MMLAVMDFHRLGVDVWFQRVGWIRQGGQCVCHDSSLLVMVLDVCYPERYRSPAPLTIGQGARQQMQQRLRCGQQHDEKRKPKWR
jgi:hypothetical protein